MIVVGNSSLKNVHDGFIRVRFSKNEKDGTVTPEYFLQVNIDDIYVCGTNDVYLAYFVYESFQAALDSGAEKWFVPWVGDLTLLI